MAPGIESLLAKMVPGTVGFEVSSGGKPAISSEDVAAALGYAGGYVPDGRLGAHLVMAKYCEDPISRGVLLHEKNLPREAHMMWWELRLRARTDRRTIIRVAETVLHDFCNPVEARRLGESFIRRRLGVGHDTWKRAYRFHYAGMMKRLYWLESPVLTILKKYLRDSES